MNTGGASNLKLNSEPKKRKYGFFPKKMGIKIVETLFDKKTYPEHRMVFYEVIFYSALTSQSLGK